MSYHEVYRKNGTLNYAYHYDEASNTIHHALEPAYTSYYPTGRIDTVHYMDHGKYHRVSGPAVVMHSVDGVIIYEGYFLHGRNYSKENYLLETDNSYVDLITGNN